MNTVSLRIVGSAFLAIQPFLSNAGHGQSLPPPDPPPVSQTAPDATPPPPPGFGSGDVSPTENTDVSTMITTGCGYDAWTGAVRRVVTDIDVPGAVSSHGLKVVRTYTSSTGIGWSLSWQWQVHGRPFTGDGSYLVNFPDGRAESFYPPPPTIPGETAYRAGRGTKERLFVNSQGNSNRSLDLYLEDGSHVHFSWIIDNSGDDRYLIDYFYAETFTDPYGQVTTLVNSTYLPNDTFNTHLTAVIDPSRRSLSFNYDPVYPGRLASITASTGQSVVYTGYLDSLQSAAYSDGTGATYTYGETSYRNSGSGCPQNVCKPYKLFTAVDVRAEGPMQSIKYVYPGLAKFQGQVAEEQYLSGRLRVSQFLPTNGIGSNSATNVEVRGDGPSRSFYIEKNGNVPLLKSKTDFMGKPETFDYDSRLYLWHHADRNGNTTTFDNEPILGRPLTITHPDALDGNGPSTTIYTYSDNLNPYYIRTIRDDNANITTYQRDPVTHQIKEIDYPDGASETFDYDTLGKVITHRRTNLYYEYADYDDTGLLKTLWSPTLSPTRPTSGPHTSFTYYPPGHVWEGRVKDVTDPKGAFPGDPQHSTTYEYDLSFTTGQPCSGRGLVTKITYPLTAADGGGRSSRTFKYDAFGNQTSETDETAKRTDYSYDEYNRLKTMALPGQPATTYDYTPTNGGSPFSHTKKAITLETSPALVKTARTYDPNFRLMTETQGSGTTAAATTSFGYDANGNQTSVTDPRGNAGYSGDYTTITTYDPRNRKKRTISPAPLNYTTEWRYDHVGNVTKIIRPDGTEETKTYDSMNRVKSETLPKDPGGPLVTTLFDYNPSGTLWKVTDGNSHVTTFEYNTNPDGLNNGFDLKSKMTCQDGSYETWTYDENKNVLNRRTTAGDLQIFAYDERDRKMSMGWQGKTWANGVAYENTYTYDRAGRLLTADNVISTVTRTYDSTGWLRTDAETFKGTTLPTHQLQYAYRADGKVSDLQLDPPSTDYEFLWSYDGMGRLETIKYVLNTDVDYQYYYDPASNVEKRINRLGGDSVNFFYDNLNRTTQRDIVLANGAIWSSEHYGFDPMNRLIETMRDEDGSIDTFAYNLVGEMIFVQYTTPTPTPTATPTPTTTPTPSVTPTPTSTPTATPTPTPTPTSTPSPTPTPPPPTPTPCAMPIIYDTGAVQHQPLLVYMSTTTQSATIFYTKAGACPADPTHNGPTPTNGTQVYDPAYPPQVPYNQVATFSALAWKSGWSDSPVNRCVFEDNRNFNTPGKRERAGANDGTAIAGLPAKIARRQSGQAPAGSHSVTYNLDNCGNRTSIVDSVSGTKSYTPNALNQYYPIAHGASVSNGASHEISVYGGTNYYYIGDSYLAKTTAGTDTYTLFYDALGRCVKRTLNGVSNFYIFDGEHWIVEYDAGNGLESSALYGRGMDELIARSNGGAPPSSQHQWYFPDRNGNISLVTGDHGAVLESYRYDAFGLPSAFSGSGAPLPGGTAINNKFMFTGREWNPIFGFYEYRARAYNPTLGRFMSEDPKGFDAGDYNLYRYCDNDPLDKTDPMGLDTLIIYNERRDGSANIFGHVALATTGQGLQSVGNNPNSASGNYSHASVTRYLAEQSKIRDTTLVVVKTTPAQEQKINAYLDARSNTKSNDFGDNCAVRCSEALRAGGLDTIKAHFPESVAEEGKRALGGRESHIRKGESQKAGAFSPFNKAPEVPRTDQIPVKHIDSLIPRYPEKNSQ